MNHEEMPTHEGCVESPDHLLVAYCETQLDMGLCVWVECCNQRAALIQSLKGRLIGVAAGTSDAKALALLNAVNLHKSACVTAGCGICEAFDALEVGG